MDGLIKSLKTDGIRLDEPLSLHTTLRIGGPADIFFETKNSGDLIRVVRLASNFGIPVTVIGGGSNVLVSDLGIRGLVIKNFSRNILVEKEKSKEILKFGDKKMARWMGSTEGTQRYNFTDLEYSEVDAPDVEVKIDSGVNLQMAISRLIDEGVTGLQWYGKIPGTIGGAVYNNIHGGSHVFGEILKSVTVLNEKGEIKELTRDELQLGYDKSRFHRTKDTILEARLILKRGDPERARAALQEWVKRKSSQPIKSAGCVFKNITEKERLDLGYPTPATGYIVEHILKMTGFRVGGAEISPYHHNFIVNKGGATAADFLSVKNEVMKRAEKEIGIQLESEIILLGEF